MGVLNNADLHKRLVRVEAKLHKMDTFYRDFGSRFAWYWHNERIKLFAIVSSLNTRDGSAHLIVLWDGYSGGINQVYDSKMLVVNPMEEEAEQPKIGKWEPWVDPREILLEEVAQEKAAEEEHDKAATADASAA